MSFAFTRTLVWLVAVGLAFLVAFSVAPGLAQSPSQPQKIAVIDVQKILTDSVRGQEVMVSLQTLQEEMAASLQAKSDELAALQARYNETRLTLAEDRLAEMEKQLEDLSITLRRSQDDAQRELQKRQREDFQTIEEAVMPIIDQVGVEFGYSLIFNKFQSGLVFAEESVDITPLVIERFNALTPSDN